MRMKHRSPLVGLFLSGLVLGLVGCSGSDSDTNTGDGTGATKPSPTDGSHETKPTPDDPSNPVTPIDPDQTSFESDDPQSGGGGSKDANGVGGAVAGAAEGDSATAAPPQAAGNDTGTADEAARAIEEADIIKLDGDRLYALSQYGGLNVVDVSERDHLKLLGRHKVLASPFEMYVRDGVAMVLYNGYGEYEQTDDGNWNYHQTSYVVILDASTPDQISELGRFPIPGYISDSRLVGDVIYVAAFENGSCWGCGTAPRTNLISLDVSDPMAITKVDELSFEERTDTYSWKRSLSSTDQRMYIAGPTWGPDEPTGSTIQVVDISDPGGDMVEGASIDVQGQIESRWQMDEYEGVLRVVSQPFTWRTDLLPIVQTFDVKSSSDVKQLGVSALMLPRQERLMSVRFDAERGYAITAEQTDPLFTIDLSDPENPKQMGDVVMPGWIYYMEPRGDRLLGLGYDQGNTDGALTVSLVDVSDLAQPKMIDRVNFGGDWAWLAEDQDRIHKAFKVLDDEQLVLIPFSGDETEYSDANQSCQTYKYVSGVQLVDWANDALELRGVAESVGQARRGFLYDERLFTVTDDRVQAFDISDRDQPQEKASLPLALHVDQAALTNGHVVRVGQDWYTNTAQVDVTTLANAGAPQGLGEIKLPDLNQSTCVNGNYRYSYLQQVVTGKDAVHFVYNTYMYDSNASKDISTSRVQTVDVSDPSAPKVSGDFELGFTPSYGYGYYYGLVSSGQPVVSTGSTLAFAQQEYDQNLQAQRGSVVVVEMSDPDKPVVNSLALPIFTTVTNLVQSGDTVALSHSEPSPVNTVKLRFFLDRVDISNPKKPELLPKVNIPGSLLAYDAESNHAVTVDYRIDTKVGVTAQVCYEQLGGSFSYPPGQAMTDYNVTPGNCQLLTQILYLVAIDADNLAHVIDRHELGQSQMVSSAALGDDRLFIGVGARNYYYAVGGDVAVGVSAGVSVGGAAFVGDVYYPYYAVTPGSTKLIVLGGLRSGSFAVGEVELETGDRFGGSITQLAATGQRAVVATGWQGKLSVVDGADTNDVHVVRDIDLAGYVSDLDVADGYAVLSMGTDGAQTVRVDD
jgi:uncharacterized secreted protein with C-terminal beta-propeller domain